MAAAIPGTLRQSPLKCTQPRRRIPHDAVTSCRRGAPSLRAWAIRTLLEGPLRIRGRTSYGWTRTKARRNWWKPLQKAEFSTAYRPHPNRHSSGVALEHRTFAGSQNAICGGRSRDYGRHHRGARRGRRRPRPGPRRCLPARSTRAGSPHPSHPKAQPQPAVAMCTMGPEHAESWMNQLPMAIVFNQQFRSLYSIAARMLPIG